MVPMMVPLMLVIGEFLVGSPGWGCVNERAVPTIILRKVLSYATSDPLSVVVRTEEAHYLVLRVSSLAQTDTNHSGSICSRMPQSNFAPMRYRIDPPCTA